MNYKMLAVLVLGMTNCFAMNNPVDRSVNGTNARQESVRKNDKFTQNERDLLGKVSAMKQSTNRGEKAALASQFLIALCTKHSDNMDDLIRAANDILAPEKK